MTQTHGKTSAVRTLASLLRLHQWVKNLLIFVPTVMAHKITLHTMGGQCLTAFLSFGLCASAAYIINDLRDLKADRQHPEKASRPLASGTVSRSSALMWIPALLACSFALGGRLGSSFLLLLVIYLITTTLYSFYLKKLILADAVTLAMLYALRIFAGAVAVNVPVSSWLLTFATFFFFSLAMIKRFMELLSTPSQKGTPLRGRAYAAEDRTPVMVLGISSGVISILVLSLYISSREITLLYQRPEILWLLCPLMLCWIGRLWILANRGLVTQDPIVYTVRDPASYVLGILAAMILLGAA